jgi:hypothetical protein
LHWEHLGDGRAMAATFDPRPLGDVIGTAGACQFSPFSTELRARCHAGSGRGTLRAFEGQENTAAGLLATIAKSRRDQGVRGDGTIIDSLAGTPVQPIYEQYRGQSGQLPPVRIERSSDGLYRFEGQETHNPPKSLIVAETDRVGCFVRDAKPMEANGPLPIGPDAATQDNVARIHADIKRVSNETRDPLGWAAVAYYLGRREVQVDEAFMYYGQPGLAMARNAFAGEGERSALERVRRAVAANVIPPNVDPIERAKLHALLRDPDGFVPCRSLASR